MTKEEKNLENSDLNISKRKDANKQILRLTWREYGQYFRIDLNHHIGLESRLENKKVPSRSQLKYFQLGAQDHLGLGSLD